MKWLILSLVPATALANWVSLTHVGNANNGTTPVSVFNNKRGCERSQNEECLDSTGKDLRYHSVADVDDETRPIYEAASNVTSCNLPAACAQIAGDAQFCPEGKFGLWGDLDDDGDFEAWCTAIVGYQQKKALVFNQTLKDAYDAEVAASVQRDNRLNQAKLALKQCVTDLEASNNPNANDMRRCLRIVTQVVVYGLLTDEETE